MCVRLNRTSSLQADMTCVKQLSARPVVVALRHLSINRVWKPSEPSDPVDLDLVGKQLSQE